MSTRSARFVTAAIGCPALAGLPARVRRRRPAYTDGFSLAACSTALTEAVIFPRFVDKLS